MLPSRTEVEEWRLPGTECPPDPPEGYIISFVAFHERSFSVSARRFIHAVLEEYSLQLQYLNPNGIQQMAAFEALCEGYLHQGAHWDLFRYLYKFVCLKDNGSAASIGYVGLQAKQGRSDEYIRTFLTSSNSGWHHDLFYLKKDLQHPLPKYNDLWIDRALDKWKWGPEKKDQPRFLPDALAALQALRDRGVDFVAVIGGYHARPLCLFEMMDDRAPFVGTVMANPLPSEDEVQRRVSQATGIRHVFWLLPDLLPMLPHADTLAFMANLDVVPSRPLLLEDQVRTRLVAATEKGQAAHKKAHQKKEIAKRKWNDRRAAPRADTLGGKHL